MRNYLIFVFVLFYVQVSLAHDLQVGLFEVKLKEDRHVTLFIRFDRKDILKALYNDCKNYGEADACLEDYVNKHFQLTFEGKKISFDLNGRKQTKQMLEVELSSLEKIEGFSSIGMFNDTLLDINREQENIVRFLLTDKLKSFRMNKDRTNTTVIY